MMSREATEAEQNLARSSKFEDSAGGSKVRRLVSQKSLDKSSSDGESDSGYSSLNEGRHELSTDAEYNPGCPSSLSFLIDLMTHSPQKNAGRDVSDMSYDVTCAGSNGVKYSSKIVTMEMRASQDMGYELHGVKAVTDHNVPISPSGGSFVGARETNAFELSPGVNMVVDSSRGQRKDLLAYCPASRNPTPSLDVAIAANTLIRLSDPNPAAVTPKSAVYSSDEPVALVQRKIHLESHPSSAGCAENVSGPVDYDEPIDYSQLSSRRRSEECENEQRSLEIIGNDFGKRDIESWATTKDIKATERSMSHSEPITNGNRYEFILSPQVGADGKLISSKRYDYHSHASDTRQGKDQAMNAAVQHPCQTAFYPSLKTSQEGSTSSMQQSPLSASPASLIDECRDSSISHSSPAQRELYSRKLQAVVTEHGVVKEDTETIYKKMAYHPKLKYLLASSQNRSPARKLLIDDNVRCSSPENKLSPSSKTWDESDKDQLGQKWVQNHQKSKAQVYSEEVFVSKENRFEESPSQEINYPSFLTHNQYNIYSELHKGSNSSTINSHIFSSLSHVQSPPQPISSMIAQLNQISHVGIGNNTNSRNNGSSCGSSSSSSSVSKSSKIKDKGSSLSMHAMNRKPSFSPHCPRPSSLSSSPSSPSSSSSSRSPSPQTAIPSRDQPTSALTGLLFSTSSSSKPAPDPYACVDCGKHYTTSSNLARHRQTHRSVCDKKARKCPHCDKVYVSMPAFSMHVRTHNQGCECPHCGKKFSRPWLLQGHIRTHTGEKPFGCPKCGKSFADKSNLRAHIQTHSTEKPYVCGRCGKAFALKSYLYKHEESSCMRGQRFRH